MIPSACFSLTNENKIMSEHERIREIYDIIAEKAASLQSISNVLMTTEPSDTADIYLTSESIKIVDHVITHCLYTTQMINLIIVGRDAEGIKYYLEVMIHMLTYSIKDMERLGYQIRFPQAHVSHVPSLAQINKASNEMLSISKYFNELNDIYVQWNNNMNTQN